MTFRRIAVFLIFGAFLFLFGCEKEELPNQLTEEVQYKVDLRVNGDQFTYEAGKNEYYLFTEHSEWQDRWIFRSSMRPLGCEELCEQSLEFLFSPNASTEMHPDIIDLVEEGSYDIGRLDSVFRISGQMPVSTAEDFESYWIVNGTDTIDDISFSNVGPFVSPVPVCLYFTDDEGDDFMKKCYWIHPGQQQLCDLNASIEFEEEYGLWTVTANSMGTPPFDYTWSNGAETRETSFSDSSTSFAVTVTDASGCRIALSRSFSGDFTSLSALNYNLLFDIDTSSSSAYLPGEVIVRYMDENGRLFTSGSGAEGGTFILSELHSAGQNGKGDPVYAFDFTFQTTASSPAGMRVELIGSGRFAIAAPN